MQLLGAMPLTLLVGGHAQRWHLRTKRSVTDQVAAWRASEVAWVDENLEGFKGRVSRDNWVDQAKKLAKS